MHRRWIVPFAVNILTVQTIVFVLRPTAVYRAIELEVPAGWLGALGACFALVALFLAVPSGHLVDRLGERRVMIAGAVLTAAAALVFWLLADSVWWLLFASIALGAGHLGTVVGQQALVANRARPEGYDTAFGRYGFAASLGQLLGPLVLLFFADGDAIPDTDGIFGWAAAASAVLLVSALLAPRAVRPTGGSTSPSGGTRDLLRHRGILKALSVSCLVLAAVDITLIFLPVLGTERDISAGVVGVLLALRAGASMLSRLFLGRLASWCGWQRLLTGSVVLSAIGLAVLALPTPFWILVLTVAVVGLALGCGQPMVMSWLAETAPPGLRGRAMALRLTGNRLGQVIIPSMTGTVAVVAGTSGVFWITAAALGAVAVISHGLRPRTLPAATPAGSEAVDSSPVEVAPADSSRASTSPAGSSPAEPPPSGPSPIDSPPKGTS